MNRSRQALRVILDESVLFFSYRWFAWGLAGLSLVLPTTRTPNTAFHAWLLILTGVLNVLATALAQSYVRVARRRPAILGLDLVASIALVWTSGGTALPFLPYALGALVLPALLYGWRGRLIASIFFALLDWSALWITARQELVTRIMNTSEAASRLAAPFLFVLICVWLVHLARHTTAPLRPRTAENPYLSRGSAQPNRRPESNEGSGGRIATVPAPPRRSFEPMVTDRSLAVPLAATDSEAQELRRDVFALTPNTLVELPTALDQLANGFGKRSNLAVRTAFIGQTRSLPRAHYLTLLRLAQEALINVPQHAHAHSALLTLRYDRSEITLTVQDDGVGLLDGTYERPGLHGLRAMRYRLAEIDGSLEVFEGETGGVTVRGIVPLHTKG